MRAAQVGPRVLSGVMSAMFQTINCFGNSADLTVKRQLPKFERVAADAIRGTVEFQRRQAAKMRDDLDSQRSIATRHLQTGHEALRLGILQSRQLGIRPEEQGCEPLARAALHNFNTLYLRSKRKGVILRQCVRNGFEDEPFEFCE